METTLSYFLCGLLPLPLLRRNSNNNNNALLIIPNATKTTTLINDSIQQTQPINIIHHQNKDPLGSNDVGKTVFIWVRHSMKAMASHLASTELQTEFDFTELTQRLKPGLSFVIEAQPYLKAVPFPLGFEVLCLKVCTHYPTLFHHFQRELRCVLYDLQNKALVQDWRQTQSWKLLKEIANSDEHRSVATKTVQPKTVQGVLGMDLEKVKAMQQRIDEFTSSMSELLWMERDSELEYTQEELDAVPKPYGTSDSLKPIEFLVSHSQP
ncbi:hypothetical protein Lalb_Chr03g0037951 [Lupinus albus]|uniref:Uncharacterized protein n=1 Tax=Lupinus albus TaxID=3870 RepID=A0A6A4QXM3_LUPAL|nr:hypothetical protein Lalb_Chr03g0037951 [Lupinus albus]